MVWPWQHGRASISLVGSACSSGFSKALGEDFPPRKQGGKNRTGGEGPGLLIGVSGRRCPSWEELVNASIMVILPSWEDGDSPGGLSQEGGGGLTGGSTGTPS